MDLRAAAHIVLGRVDVAAGVQAHMNPAHDLAGAARRVVLLDDLHFELHVFLESRRRAHGEILRIKLETEVDEKRVQRMTSGKLTMDDFLFQFEQVNKMGSLKKILDLMGLGGNMKAEDLEKAEKDMKIWKSIIQLMAKQERETPEMLNAIRIKRIARGSGRSAGSRVCFRFALAIACTATLARTRMVG